AIPNLLRARIAANEASSVSSIRTINTAEVTYQTSYPTVGYAVTLAALGPGGAACAAPAQANACLLDNVLASAITAGTAKSGYYYGVGGVVAGALVLTYTVGSSAAVFNQTGAQLLLQRRWRDPFRKPRRAIRSRNHDRCLPGLHCPAVSD